MENMLLQKMLSAIHLKQKNYLYMWTEYTNGKKKRENETLFSLLNVYYSNLKNKTYQ